MTQNQPEQEESQQVLKLSNTLYYIQFMVGLLVIITGYIVLKAITDYVGLWATVLIIAVLSILVARKL